MTKNFLTAELRVAWSISAWELSFDRRGNLGLPERHILSQEIQKLEKRLPDIGMRVTSYDHLMVARAFFQVAIESYQRERFGLNKIFAPILSDSLDSLLRQKGFDIDKAYFKSVHGMDAQIT